MNEKVNMQENCIKRMLTHYGQITKYIFMFGQLFDGINIKNMCVLLVSF